MEFAIVTGGDTDAGIRAAEKVRIAAGASRGLVRLHEIGDGTTNTSVSTLETTIMYAANRGIQCIILVNDDNSPDMPVGNVAAWAKRFGPGGTLWQTGQPGAGLGHLAVRWIEWGNEWSFSYKSGFPGEAGYRANARTVARTMKAAQIAATDPVNGNPNIKFIMEGGAEGGDQSPDWMNTIFDEVPDLASRVDGFTIHPYGPDDDSGADNTGDGFNRLIAQVNMLDARGLNTMKLFITEDGIESDESSPGVGRSLTFNYNWPTNMNYAQAAQGMLNKVHLVQAHYGSRIKVHCWFDGVDRVDTGTTTARDSYFGLYKIPGEIAKGAIPGSAVTLTNEFPVTSAAVGGDTTPPTVSITAPANAATVSGTVAVTATAADNVGVVGVQFKLDGSNLGAEDTTSPYSVNWDTTTASSGSHTLTAVARDAAGNNTISAAINVTIAGGGGGGGTGVASYVIGSKVNTNTSGANWPVNGPAGAVAGDWVVVGLSLVTSIAVTPPAGFIVGPTDVEGATDGRGRLFYGLFSTVGPGPYIFTNASAIGLGVSIAIRGADQVTPMNVPPTNNNAGYSATWSGTSQTTTIPGCCIVNFTGGSPDVSGRVISVNAPAIQRGFAENVDFIYSIATLDQAAAGPIAISGTLAPATETLWSLQLAFAPAPAATGGPPSIIGTSTIGASNQNLSPSSAYASLATIPANSSLSYIEVYLRGLGTNNDNQTLKGVCWRASDGALLAESNIRTIEGDIVTGWYRFAFNNLIVNNSVNPLNVLLGVHAGPRTSTAVNIATTAQTNGLWVYGGTLITSPFNPIGLSANSNFMMSVRAEVISNSSDVTFNTVPTSLNAVVSSGNQVALAVVLPADARRTRLVVVRRFALPQAGSDPFDERYISIYDQVAGTGATTVNINDTVPLSGRYYYDAYAMRDNFSRGGRRSCSTYPVPIIKNPVSLTANASGTTVNLVGIVLTDNKRNTSGNVFGRTSAKIYRKNAPWVDNSTTGATLVSTLE